MSQTPDPNCLCCHGTGVYRINDGPAHPSEEGPCACTADPAEMDRRFVHACEQVDPFNRNR